MRNDCPDLCESHDRLFAADLAERRGIFAAYLTAARALNPLNGKRGKTASSLAHPHPVPTEKQTFLCEATMIGSKKCADS